MSPTRMTLYRMAAADETTICQAQYALSSHQEEVKKEPWFLEFIMTRLFHEINPKIVAFEMENVSWHGWTEVWEFAGEMDWDEQPTTEN